MRVAIIPARGGSKRIPRKNIRLFCGKPMITWSISMALKSRCFDRVIVSTDDKEIAEVAHSAGAEIPFIRPNELSDDFSGITPVVSHAIKTIDAEQSTVKEVCCILPTAPFLKADDLRSGLALLTQEDIDYVIPITNFVSPIQRALRVTNNNRVQLFNPDFLNIRSQDCESAWHDAAQFYWGRAGAWTSEKPIFGDRSMPIFLPRQRVQDIDTPEDFEYAEWLFRALKD